MISVIVPTVERVLLTGFDCSMAMAGGMPRIRIDLRLVHPVEKLPRVGGERLDVAPLALRVDRIEGEARFPAAARAGDDVQLPQRQIEIDALEIVLPRAADFDHAGIRNNGQAVFLHRKRRARSSPTYPNANDGTPAAVT